MCLHSVTDTFTKEKPFESQTVIGYQIRSCFGSEFHSLCQGYATYRLGEKAVSNAPLILASDECLYKAGFHLFKHLSDAVKVVGSLSMPSYVVVEVEGEEVLAIGIEDFSCTPEVYVVRYATIKRVIDKETLSYKVGRICDSDRIGLCT